MRVVLHYTTAFKTDYENDFNRMHMAMDIELKKIQYYIEGMIIHINIDDWKRKYAIDKNCLYNQIFWLIKHLS